MHSVPLLHHSFFPHSDESERYSRAGLIAQYGMGAVAVCILNPVQALFANLPLIHRLAVQGLFNKLLELRPIHTPRMRFFTQIALHAAVTLISSIAFTSLLQLPMTAMTFLFLYPILFSTTGHALLTRNSSYRERGPNPSWIAFLEESCSFFQGKESSRNLNHLSPSLRKIREVQNRLFPQLLCLTSLLLYTTYTVTLSIPAALTVALPLISLVATNAILGTLVELGYIERRLTYVLLKMATVAFLFPFSAAFFGSVGLPIGFRTALLTDAFFVANTIYEVKSSLI